MGTGYSVLARRLVPRLAESRASTTVIKKWSSTKRATGNFPAGTEVKTTEGTGGKTAREVAEHNRIQQLGGVRSQPGSQTSNIRNPIGKNRQHLLKKEN